MYGCESWTIKKAECRSIDAFNLWCWRRLLRIPRTARRSSQSILKEISPEYSLEGQILKLKLQYFGHLMRRTDSLEKTLMLGEGDNKGWDSWMASPTLWTWVWASSGSWWWTGKPDCGLWGQTRWLSHWTELSQLGVGGELLESERLEKGISEESESELDAQLCLTLPPHGLYVAHQAPLCPWNSPGKNTEVGSHFLLQGIFPTRGLNSDLLHCKQILYYLNHQGSPISEESLAQFLEWKTTLLQIFFLGGKRRD